MFDKSFKNPERFKSPSSGSTKEIPHHSISVRISLVASAENNTATAMHFIERNANAETIEAPRLPKLPNNDIDQRQPA